MQRITGLVFNLAQLRYMHENVSNLLLRRSNGMAKLAKTFILGKLSFKKVKVEGSRRGVV